MSAFDTSAGLQAADLATMLERLHWEANGLLPAVVQDANTKQVLMVAYMTRESLRETVEIGETVFWSRSRGERWHKGETSGNVQRVQAIYADCDADTLLILVDPAGPACHTGAVSCFFRTLDQLTQDEDGSHDD